MDVISYLLYMHTVTGLSQKQFLSWNGLMVLFITLFPGNSSVTQGFIVQWCTQ